ncbi:MAG: CRTAC1 family protein, partial [Longimicrobiales bacterium]|nr:CRTAC1 family protein [Longimicrobiales bacterium]
RAPFTRLHDLMRIDPLYQGALDRLRGPLGEATGLATLAFSNEVRLDIPDETAVLDALRFRDASDFAGLAGLPARAGIAADLEGDGDDDLLLWNESGVTLLRNELGRFVDLTPAGFEGVTGVRSIEVADVDSDGVLDLYLVRDGPNQLHRHDGAWGFEDTSARDGADDAGSGLSAVFVDIDHDADLDLIVGNEGATRIHRNDGRGRFTPVPGAMGIAGVTGVLAFAFADLDDDGDIDLLAARGDAGLTRIMNDREDRLRPIGVDGGVPGGVPVDALAVGDLDNDGFPDVVTFGRGRAPTLLRGSAEGGLTPGDLEVEIASPVDALRSPSSADAVGGTLFDFDNDGVLDLAVAAGTGLRLLHNEGGGRFREISRTALVTPLGGGDGGAGGQSVTPAAILDYNEDGDLDLLVRTPDAVRLLRNDGGNLNHHLTLNLTALGPGSGKVNRFAVGSLVEIRAGDLYQFRTVRGPRLHIGLGSHLKADVIRIVWTNGVPQYLHFPGTDQDLIESQELKGSCAFVYAWNGEAFEFVTDATWKSALGMPVGIMGGANRGMERVYAPAGSSREYLRIPSERLRARDGRYTLQITEELWEVAYIDEVKLLAVDHPDSVELFVDEKFVPPAPPRLTLYHVSRRIPPTSAVDHLGFDVSERLSGTDHIYLSNVGAGPYQGITEPHAVVLELPREVAEAADPHLFLQGWIFPSDASINLAMTQREDPVVQPPHLQIPDGRGGWKTVIPDIGFPSGKNKVVVVDLTGLIDPDDPRVRIASRMEVYWDHAFFAVGGVRGLSLAGDAERAAAVLGGQRAASGLGVDAASTAGGRAASVPGGRAGRAPDGASPADARADAFRLHLLRPLAADLHFRGFSREYRKGGRSGPHWFDYQRVEAESPWLPIRGRYTRYGEVRPLLTGADDRYVVMAPGDEMTVDFDASGPEPGEGWTRTFLLYTDGWIKDADLNTATGQTVEPLPFQSQTVYPYGAEVSFPDGPEHRAWLADYQTREVTGTTRALHGGRTVPTGAGPTPRR